MVITAKFLSYEGWQVMNVLLMNSDFSTLSDSKIMPLTMYSLGAILRENGYYVKIIDPLLYRSGYYKESLDDVLSKICYDFDVIAFSTNAISWAYAKKNIELIRTKNYRGYIVVGGVHATTEYDSIMKNAYVDFVLRGEGEFSLLSLLDSIKNRIDHYKIPGIVYTHGSRIRMTKQSKLIELNDCIPLPAYDLVPPNAYKTLSFESSRGCFGDCTFCSITYKKCWRGFSADIAYKRLNAATTIFMEHTDMSVRKHVLFVDDCFTADIKRANELLSLMKKSYKDCMFLIEARLKHLFDDSLIENIQSFPNIMLQVGVENGYNEGLLRIKKGITVKDIEQCAQILFKHKLTQNVFFSFIIGMPGETKENMLKTLKTVENLRYNYGIHCYCSWWLPFPSPEFDVFKTMQTDLSDNIFDTIDWHADPELFCKMRPHLNEKDVLEITELMMGSKRPASM